MHIVGYYLALCNLHVLEGCGQDIDDVSVKMANLDTLSTYLRSYPDFDIENFKKDRVNRVGNVGMFITNNLREFCLNGEGNPDDEGLIITFTYKDKVSTEEDPIWSKLENLAFLIRKDGLPEDRVHRILEELQHENRHHNKIVVIRDPREEKSNESN